MIKSSVYYSQDTDKIYLMTPVYVEQIDTNIVLAMLDLKMDLSVATT